ncbi:MAG TPA: 2-C-methyl-D-erythritol 4-phosphate cytidylyltransferase, partial [Gemmatimonadaceae bacterium]|nr:2-C-methyl-D-erythritol 4-phosphate cytidylyltransferase [Gemmatimonadaceae bacterium]
VGVVIVAAGTSTRAGGGELKQLRWVAGKPMLLHSLQTFMARPDVVCVVCVLPPRYAGDPPPWIFQCDVGRLMIAPGGDTRTESVSNGLDDLPDEASVVLIHDAARPLVDNPTIDRVVQHVRSGESAIAALPVIDTLKEVDASHRIVRTLDRTSLWRAQTPQGFPREVIVRAHREAAAGRLSATDDAALCERLGIRVAVVRGSERALKVTEEEDFTRVEALVRSGE